MSNISLFDSGRMPAHLRKAAAMFGSANDDLKTSSGPAFPVLSIKGKVWTMVENKTRTPLMNDDGDPLASVRVIIVRANPALSKVFYKTGFTEGDSEGAIPNCSSNDGIKPDPQVKTPESTSCAACEHNVWGSGRDGQGRACQDSRRIAIAPENAPDKVMLLRVPPASLKPLSQYGDLLKKRDVPYQGVVTKIGFELEASTPKLVFTPVDFTGEDALNTVSELYESELVLAICGLDTANAKETPVQEDEPAPAPVVEKPKPVAAAPKAPVDRPKAAPKPAAASAFGSKPAAVKAVEAEEVVEAAPANPARAAKDEALAADLDNMLGEFSFDDV